MSMKWVLTLLFIALAADAGGQAWAVYQAHGVGITYADFYGELKDILLMTIAWIARHFAVGPSNAPAAAVPNAGPAAADTAAPAAPAAGAPAGGPPA